MKNTKNFIEELKKLNPTYRRNIHLFEGDIHLSVRPECLVLPEGYSLRKPAFVFSNKGNVPFWKTHTFDIIYAKRM